MADTLSVVDNRTGTSYEIPISDGAIRAIDLRQIKTGPEDFGLLSYDPVRESPPSSARWSRGRQRTWNLDGPQMLGGGRATSWALSACALAQSG